MFYLPARDLRKVMLLKLIGRNEEHYVHSALLGKAKKLEGIQICTPVKSSNSDSKLQPASNTAQSPRRPYQADTSISLALF